MDNEQRVNSVWMRLQCLSCEHARRIGPQYIRTWPKRQVSVPETIQENVEILGRGDEVEIKSRVLWYITFHPQVFDACSARNWAMV